MHRRIEGQGRAAVSDGRQAAPVAAGPKNAPSPRPMIGREPPPAPADKAARPAADKRARPWR